VSVTLASVTDHRNLAASDHIKIGINFVEHFGHWGSPSDLFAGEVYRAKRQSL
jgi:hypothetical protein